MIRLHGIIPRILIMTFVYLFLLNVGPVYSQQPGETKYTLIAHRGGVVDAQTAENSRESIVKAISKGYWMIEIDLRITRDSILIINHGPGFKRYYGLDQPVGSMTWNEIAKLKSITGSKVIKFEDALKLCKGKLQVMIDNKIKGNDTALFYKMIGLLKKYSLDEHALMIGTDESTDFFTGKIRLSCTRKQLEENMLKPGYKASDYYLFSGNITKEDNDWAIKNGIMVVGAINKRKFDAADMAEAEEDAERLKASRVTIFQIDSAFDIFFR